MFNECRHILTSGHRCKSPALRDQAFCYFHKTARRFANIRATPTDPILFPSTEDTAGVQIAINQVLRSLAAQRIDGRQAGVFFYGLQIAARLAAKTDEKPTERVRETCEDSDGSPLAPEKSYCEPPADCVNCRRRNSCASFRFYQHKVEDLEERLEAEREATESEASETNVETPETEEDARQAQA